MMLITVVIFLYLLVIAVGTAVTEGCPNYGMSHHGRTVWNYVLIM
jgi:hypothetical protein